LESIVAQHQQCPHAHLSRRFKAVKVQAKEIRLAQLRI